MATNDTETVETENGFEITPEDEVHVRRLRALREGGTVNMATEVRAGLRALLRDEDADETYQWIRNRSDLYFSGDWVDCDLPDRDDEEATA